MQLWLDLLNLRRFCEVKVETDYSMSHIIVVIHKQGSHELGLNRLD